MQKTEYRSLEAVMELTRMLRDDSRHSRWRTLATLFFSTALVIVAFLATQKGEMPIASTGRFIFCFPAVLNLVEWFYWGFDSYMALARGFSDRFAMRPEQDNQERDILDGYEGAKYVHRRHVRIERFITFLTAVQVASMIVVAVVTLLR